jgi:hypothetical protein
VNKIENIKDNNILKIEQLSLAYKVRIGVKTPAAERVEVKYILPLITHACVHIILMLTSYFDSASKVESRV